MTLLMVLQLAAGKSATEIRDFLNSVALRVPDLAPTAQRLLIALNSAVSAENLAALATALPKEIADIASGKLDPREHPSDSA